MADFQRFTGNGAKYGTTSLAGLVGGSVTFSPNLTQLIGRNDGEQNPTFLGTITNEMPLSFDTRDISFLTAPVIIDGTNQLIVYAIKYNDAGGIGAGQKSFTMNRGLLVPQTLTARAGEAAVMSLQAFPASEDGEVFPVSVGTLQQTIPLHGGAHTLGTLSLGSDVINLQSLTVEFNYTTQGNAGENGYAFPTEYIIPTAEITLTAETADLDEATAERFNTGQNVTSSLSSTFPQMQEGGIPSAPGLTLTAQEAVVNVSNYTHDAPGVATLTAKLIETASGYISWS